VRITSPDLKLRVACICYRDVSDSPRFERLDFTEDIGAFSTFLAGVAAVGGADTAEDIAGALVLASGLPLPWQSATRLVFHIADAPCHGKKFHDLAGDCNDKFPGGDPFGLCPVKLLQTLREMGVDFVFGHITPHTEKMIKVFNADIHAASVSAGDAAPYVPYVREHKVDTDPTAIANAVSSSVTSSISATVSAGKDKKVPARELKEFRIDTEIPDFTKLPAMQVEVYANEPIVAMESLYKVRF
jgi:hypothetical protein